MGGLGRATLTRPGPLTTVFAETSSLMACSGVTHGPPALQPLQILNDRVIPQRSASLSACLNIVRQGSLMNGGPLGCISVLASPESNTTAPLIPLSLIASISRVIPSLLTDPFTHRHHTHVRDSTGGTENSRRKSYASSACNAASGVSSMAKISVMVCFIMGMLVSPVFVACNRLLQTSHR